MQLREGDRAWEGSTERTRESRYTNRIRGGVWQGEQAMSCEAVVVKARRRKCGDCAGKDRVLTWGDLALCLKGRPCERGREVSRGRSSRGDPTKGRRSGRSSPAALVSWTDSDVHEGEARHDACEGEARVGVAASNQLRRVDSKRYQAACAATRTATSTIPTARCGPACRVVWEGSGQL